MRNFLKRGMVEYCGIILGMKDEKKYRIMAPAGSPAEGADSGEGGILQKGKRIKETPRDGDTEEKDLTPMRARLQRADQVKAQWAPLPRIANALSQLGDVRRVKLGELFEFRNGYTPSKALAEFWEGGNIPWFRMEDIRKNGRKLSDSILHITEKAVKGKGLFKANSFILATTATIGEHALLIADSLANQRFTNLKICESLINEVDVGYLYHYMFIIGEWCKKNVNVGGFASVDIAKLKNVEIPLPPIDVQRRIAGVLDKWTELEAELEAELELRVLQFEHYRETLLCGAENRETKPLASLGRNRLITKPEASSPCARGYPPSTQCEPQNGGYRGARELPAEVMEIRRVKLGAESPAEGADFGEGLSPILPIASPNGSVGRSVNEPIGDVGDNENGEAVRFVKLGEIVAIKRGSRVVKKDLSKTGKYPVFQNSLKPLGYYDKSNCESNSAFVIIGGAAGDVGYCDKDFWAADDCLTISSNEQILSRYVYHWLLTQLPFLKGRVRKASVPRLSRSVIDSITIPLPPLAEQRRIAGVLDKFETLTHSLTEGLPAEIAARRQQYAYYRDRLLSFGDGGNVSLTQQHRITLTQIIT